MHSAARRARRFPLELLHPDGAARRIVVLGSNCPAVLPPEPGDGAEEARRVPLLRPPDRRPTIHAGDLTGVP